ncbi:MAG: HD domain-containing protein [Armatimonadota bacterium]|nr:HD domain-containing protein [Armatimonadota bacterium]
MQQQYRAYRIFRIVIIGLCVTMAIPTVMICQSTHVPWSQLLFLIAIATLCELAPVALGANYAEVTLTLPLVIMVMLVYGTLPVIILGPSAFILASALGWSSALLSHRFTVPSTQRTGLSSRLRALIFNVILAWVGRPWVGRHSGSFGWVILSVLYNASHLCLNIVFASLVYTLAGGALLGSPAISELRTLGWVQTIAAAVAAMTVFFASDAGIYGVATALYESLPAYTRTLGGFVLRCQMLFRQTIASVYKSDVVLTVLGAVLTFLYLRIGTTAVIVLFGSLYMIRDAIRQTFQQIQTYRDTVTTLGTYMQRYHPYTRGHLKRVADLSERLAKELRLPLESVMMMPDAGMLHDIGKVGVSEDILDKVGKLTDDEWTVIKQHPVKGAEIVSHLPFLDKIVDWVKYHHKWADGTGYPDDGKKDGQIPIEATIIAVADAFDAMTDDRDLSVDWQCDTCGHRPDDGGRPEFCPQCGVEKKRVYREPLSLNDAIDQLRRGAGSQFSPRVVKAFLRMLERDGVHIDG